MGASDMGVDGPESALSADGVRAQVVALASAMAVIQEQLGLLQERA